MLPTLLSAVLFAAIPASLGQGAQRPVALQQEEQRGPLFQAVAEGDPVPAWIEEISGERMLASVRTLAGFHTRHTLSDTESETRGIGAARRWIRGQFDELAGLEGSRLQVFEQRASRSFRTRAGRRSAEVVNVAALLPGTGVEPNGRTYVVSGHYDSRVQGRFDAESFAPGANDDASGTAAVLELARVLARVELPANVIFLCVAGEEQGLWGAELFQERMAAENRDIDAFLTNDIIGGIEGGGGASAPRTMRVFSGSDGLHSKSRELARLIQLVARKYVPAADVRMVFRLDRFGRGGDHIPAHNAKIAAVRFSEAYEHYDRQHQDVREEGGRSYGDLPEHLDPHFMGLVAKVNGAALLELALAPPPPSTLVLKAALRYDTQLRWTASPQDGVRYEVLWRDTTAPQWETSRLVPAGTTETAMPPSADWVFFGLRAIGPGGHGSRVIYPGRP